MFQSRTITSIMLFVAFVSVFLHMPKALAEDPPEKLMEVKLVLSDSEILTDDGLAYKVKITNLTRSTIHIAVPTSDPPFSCVIERKEAGGDWREIWNYPFLTRGPGQRLIRVAAGSTWAEYGQVFLTNKDGKFPVDDTAFVFDKPGKCELRARVKSAIGSYVSDPVPLEVKARPTKEYPLDKRFESYGHLILDQQALGTPAQPLSEHFNSLSKRHPLGGVAKTLKMMLGVHLYVESGEVERKAASWSEAFKVLSVGLDEVRQDQLALLLAYGAEREKQWKDLAFLVEQLKDEGNWRRQWQTSLEGAIQKGEFQAP